MKHAERRLSAAGYEIEADGSTALIVSPKRSDMPYAEQRRLIWEMVSRWNAVEDALAAIGEPPYGHETMEGVAAILRRAINGEG